MNQLESEKAISESLNAARLIEIDAQAIKSYNARDRGDHLLHPELGPSAFEGDIDRAPVVLLLSNPGFDCTTTVDDHSFARPGWPLAGLHPEAPEGLRVWWQRRLGALIGLYGAQRVSERVACLQLTPWASKNFDRGLRLPSRTLMLDAASQVAERGALIIVMRSERLRLEARGLGTYQARYRVRSWRCSFVSEGNVGPETWPLVRQAVAG